jgi:Cu/Ag efflux protein CusF
MTMTFKVAKLEVLQGIKVGEQVRFGLRTQDMNGTVTWIKPAGQ